MSFEFHEEQLADPETFLKEAAAQQTNYNTTGQPVPLKTTRSESGGGPATLNVISISDAAMGSQAFLPEGAVADIYNRVGQDVIATGIGENGGPQKVLGGAMPIAPNDLILKAEQATVEGTTGTIDAGTVPGGTLNMGSFPPPPDGGYRGTTEMRKIYGIDGNGTPPPAGSQWVTQFTWWDGRTYTVHKATVPVWNLVNGIMKKYNYGPGKDSDGGGGHVVRRITGGSGWSLHSYGIAVDINPAQNPYGSKLISDMPAGMIHEILQIKTASGVTAVRWGGHYSGNKDAMHFEVMATPEEIAAGLTMGGSSGPVSRTVPPT